MIDTHCHLNFEIFDTILEKAIADATAAGVTHYIVPGTDIESSAKAVAVSKKFENTYAAVGIHPHHAYQAQYDHAAVPALLKELDTLLDPSDIIAIGEIGLDRHTYESTKYEDYTVTSDFLETQQRLFTHQLFLAAFIRKPIIVHNREATDWLLDLLTKHWNDWFSGKMVFHCCEADVRLLEFAKERNSFIGVDGDVTYSKKKAAFIKEVPLELLVLETDAPFLTPEPVRQTKKFPNEPVNLVHTAKFVAELKGNSLEELDQITTQNAKTLFDLN